MLGKRPVAATTAGGLTMEQAYGMGATAANPFTPGHWSHSLILRLILGLIFTAGMLFSFRRLTDAVLFFTYNQAAEPFWASETGFYLWQPVQFMLLVLGTMLASAGRSRTTILGLMIGAIIGFVVLLSFPLIGMPINPFVPGILYYVMPIWSALAGGLGAKLGEWLWHPPILSTRRPEGGLVTPAHSSWFFHGRQLLSGLVSAEVRWLRVIVAVAAILASLWYMNDGVNWVIRRLGAGSDPSQLGVQKRLIVTMLQGAVVIVACAFAAASSGNGLVHGFWIGVVVGVVNLLRYVLFPGPEPLDVISVLSEIGWVWLVSLAAGGFGALAMPSVSYLAQKRKVNPSNISVPLD
jgi:hypothetical protein